MNKWTPDESPQQARRIGKTLEELGELTAVLARVSIQGINAIDPASGVDNRARLIDEMADVVAQIHCNCQFLELTDEELRYFSNRMIEKKGMMQIWESHF